MVLTRPSLPAYRGRKTRGPTYPQCSEGYPGVSTNLFSTLVPKSIHWFGVYSLALGHVSRVWNVG